MAEGCIARSATGKNKLNSLCGLIKKLKHKREEVVIYLVLSLDIAYAETSLTPDLAANGGIHYWA